MEKAIVIGATWGMGREIARILAAQGYQVGIAGRREERLQALRDEISSPVVSRRMDVSDTEDAVRMFQELAKDLGGVELVVLCAGIVRPSPEPDWQLDRETIQTDVLGFAALADAAVSIFRTQKHGHLVGLSSLSALVCSDRTNAYCASKAFVSSYLRGLRVLLNRSEGNYCVTEVLPGWVHTEMTGSADPSKIFWSVSAQQAAKQICGAIRTHRRKIYVSRRWRLIGWLLSIVPERYRIK